MPDILRQLAQLHQCINEHLPRHSRALLKRARHEAYTQGHSAGIQAHIQQLHLEQQQHAQAQRQREQAALERARLLQHWLAQEASLAFDPQARARFHQQVHDYTRSHPPTQAQWQMIE